MSTNGLLSLRGVEKRFPGRAEPVLSDVNLSVAEGELVAVVGCSGAGKTTLISLAAGLLTPERGEVWFDGGLLCAAYSTKATILACARDFPTRLRNPLSPANVL